MRIKFFSMTVAALILLSTLLGLCSCAGTAYKTKMIQPTETDNKIVGKIGSNNIYYDEFSAVVYMYRSALAQKYGKDIWDDGENAEKYRAELEEMVYHGIKANYAVISACEDYGIKNVLNKRDIKEKVDDYIYDLLCEAYNELIAGDGDNADTPESGDSEDTYLTDLDKKQLAAAYSYYDKSLREEGLSDRVMRFFIGVEYAENFLFETLCKNGKIPYSDDAVWEIMTSDDFIHTDHIFLRCENEKDFEEKYSKAVEVRDALRGGVPLEEYITNGTDQDFNRTSTAGYYFGKGEMDKNYEDAAFALEIGDVSDVIKLKNGYYVIKRYEKDTKYMNTHLEYYRDSICYSTLDRILETRQSELVFELNDIGKALDLVTLMPDNMPTGSTSNDSTK